MEDIWIATNASVNSLANFHAVMGPQAVYSASLYIQLSSPFGLLNLNFVNSLSLVVHSHTIPCQNRLWCLPTWYYTQSSLKFDTALGG